MEQFSEKISEKELSGLNDLLSEEELLVKKFKMLANHAENEELRQQMNNVSDKHQGHLNDLYSLLG